MLNLGSSGIDPDGKRVPHLAVSFFWFFATQIIMKNDLKLILTSLVVFCKCFIWLVQWYVWRKNAFLHWLILLICIIVSTELILIDLGLVQNINHLSLDLHQQKIRRVCSYFVTTKTSTSVCLEISVLIYITCLIGIMLFWYISRDLLNWRLML